MTTSLAAAQLQRPHLEDIGAICKSKEVVVRSSLIRVRAMAIEG
uniref:Uncharacterized protein n=1 Tax=Physcomitrium patens TaxID=3218 RepID=A0A7I4BPH5_PHYPA